MYREAPENPRKSAMIDVTDEMVEAAAYPIFLGVTKEPWTSYADDEPACPPEPFTKNHARNIARAALREIPVDSVAAVPRADAEALARAVSASLTLGEDSPLAQALSAYLEKHPWSDL
jgi:malic enzyme